MQIRPLFSCIICKEYVTLWLQTERNKKMSAREQRQEVVKMIVSSEEVSTQDELLAALERAGVKCTQATLSRDLRQLRITKAVNRAGMSVYVLPQTRVHRTVSDTHASVSALHSLGVLNIKFSGNLAVVKTLPGYAAHVAYDKDNAQLDCVLGTVAGDDTVFVALDEDIERSYALNAIASAAHYHPI